MQNITKTKLSVFEYSSLNLDEYDDFIITVESMNIKRVIELKQAALDRFNK